MRKQDMSFQATTARMFEREDDDHGRYSCTFLRYRKSACDSKKAYAIKIKGCEWGGNAACKEHMKLVRA